MFAYQQVPRSHIRYALMLEWFLAARWANLDFFNSFCELDGDEQSFVIAAYRTQMQIDAVLAWWQTRQAKRRSRTK